MSNENHTCPNEGPCTQCEVEYAHEYKCSQAISAGDPPFYALIMSAMRQGDSDTTW